jgi:hypothetical protein
MSHGLFGEPAMPDMQQPPTQAATSPIALADAAGRFDDCDYALGCECADPSLQIEQWGRDEPAATSH